MSNTRAIDLHAMKADIGTCRTILDQEVVNLLRVIDNNHKEVNKAIRSLEERITLLERTISRSVSKT